MTRVFTLLAVLAGTTFAEARPLTVVLDAGHGGKDRGTTRGSVEEADITLYVAKKLKERLARNKAFRPLLSRESQSGLSLPDRARVAAREKADLLISIHVNSSPDSRARGAEFYFQNQLESDEESMFLAHKENGGETTERGAPGYAFFDGRDMASDVSAIVLDLLNSDRVWTSSRLARALKSEWRGHKKSRANSIRQAPFFVLSQMTVPSSLVELGFLTNREDFGDLTNSQRLDEMAEDLYRGLVAYKESIDKERSAF